MRSEARWIWLNLANMGFKMWWQSIIIMHDSMIVDSVYFYLPTNQNSSHHHYRKTYSPLWLLLSSAFSKWKSGNGSSGPWSNKTPSGLWTLDDPVFVSLSQPAFGESAINPLMLRSIDAWLQQKRGIQTQFEKHNAKPTQVGWLDRLGCPMHFTTPCPPQPQCVVWSAPQNVQRRHEGESSPCSWRRMLWLCMMLDVACCNHKKETSENNRGHI